MAFFILFTPEIRRILTHFADRFNIQRFLLTSQTSPISQPEKYAKAITKALLALQASGNGALIVIEGDDILTEIEQKGEILYAEISAKLIQSIFQKESPLHDGAILIRNGKIVAAHCILPISDKKLAAEVGTRHRAGVGLTELTDALVLILSEEKNVFSLSKEGNLALEVKNSEIIEAIITHISAKIK